MMRRRRQPSLELPQVSAADIQTHELPPQLAAAAAAKADAATTAPTAAPVRRQLVTDDEILAELPREMFAGQEAGFDPIVWAFKNLPEHVTEEYIVGQLERRERAHGIIRGQLATKVMKNSKSFVQGMGFISEVETDLQMTRVICMNARVQLQHSLESLTHHGLTVLSNYKKKSAFMNVAEMIEAIKGATEDLDQFRQCMAQGDFPAAISLCLRVRKNIALFKQFDSLRGMADHLQDNRMIEKQMEQTLRLMCRRFESVSYERVLRAYKLLDSSPVAVAELVDKEFLSVVQSLAEEVARSQALRSVSDLNKAEELARMEYPELCKCISENHIFEALLQVAELLSDVMLSHHQMLEWHASLSGDDARLRLFAELKSHLENAVPNLWFKIQLYLYALLTEAPVGKLKIDPFMVLYRTAHQFLEIGERWSGSEGHKMRSALRELAYNYFLSFHRSCCEDLRTLVEFEMWQRYPVAKDFTVNNLKELSMFLRRQSAGPAMRSPYSQMTKQAMFAAFAESGNPFALAAEAQAAGQKKPPPKGAKSAAPDAAAAAAAATANDDDALNQETLDDVAADAPAPAGPPPQPASGDSSSGSRSRVQESNLGPVLTSASMGLCKFVVKYLNMMSIMDVVAYEIFTDLTRLFEYYIFCVYDQFGSTPQPMPQVQAAEKEHTVRLQNMITKVRGAVQHVVDEKPERRKYPLAPRSSSVDVTRPHNLFGLHARVVGTESLLFLGQVLEALRARVLAMLPNKLQQQATEFFSRTQDNIREIRCHIYRVVSFLIVNQDQFIMPIAAGRYDVDQVGYDASSFVTSVQKEYQRLQSQLASMGADVVPSDVEVMIWEYLLITLTEVIVEGLSRVKKCTADGRAQMSLDMGALYSALTKITKIKPIPNQAFVDNFVKAWYLPEREQLEWMKMHQEYALRHHMGLFAQGLGQQLKKKQRSDFVRELEEHYAGH